MTLTHSGSYVISDEVIELIPGDRVKIDFDVSIDTENPEFQELEEELKAEVEEGREDYEQELEAEFRQAFELEIESYTYNFQGTPAHTDQRKQ